MNFISDEQITVADSSIGLNVPDTAYRCFIEIWTASIYFTLDAVLPSSANGGRVSPGDIINLMGSDSKPMRDNLKSVMGNLRMLRQGATSALAIVHYFD